MERRMLLAIVLAVFVIVGWTYFFAPPPRKLPATPPETDPTRSAQPGNPAHPGNPAQPGNPANPPAPGVPAPPPAPEPPKGPPPVQKAEHLEFAVTPAALPAGSEWHDVGFTTTGGAITWVRLENAYEQSARDQPERHRLDLILGPYPDQLTGMVALDAEDTEGLRRLDWTVDKRGDDEVAFSFLTTTGLRIRKRFVMPTGTDRYDLDVVVTVERAAPPTPQDAKTVSLRLLGVSGHLHEPAPQSISPTPVQAVRLVLTSEDEPYHHDYALAPVKIDNRDLRPFRLVGTVSQYFTSTLFSEGGAQSPAVTRVWMDGGDASERSRNDKVQPAIDRLKELYRARDHRETTGNELLASRVGDVAWNFQRAWVEFDATVAGPGAAAVPSTFHLYSGPLSRRVLAQDRYEPLHDLITYPIAPDVVARFLLWVFDRFRDLTGSAGISIVLMTLFVRFSMMPLSVRNQLSMRRHGRKMARIKPKLEQLRERWSRDPRKFREEQVKLFKEHGVGFPLGCLMLFLQIPIFMALFSSLRIEYGVRHESFLWIHDLAGPDRLVPFGRQVLGFPPGGLWSLNILPLLYMGLSIWQQRMMPKPMDEQQAQQMKTARWMSIIFPVLLYNYTAALALYMVVSTTIAIVESRIVRAKDAHDAAAA